MALRSRVSSFARPVTNAVTEADVAAAAHSQAEEVLEAVTEEPGSSAPAVVGIRGGVREPAVENTTVIEPETEAETPARETAADPAETQERKRRGPKPGSTRKVKAVEPVPDAVTPIDQLAAPQVRTMLKDLEAEIKEVRTRHESEMHGLRSKYRALHDRLFDLTK